MLAIIIVFVNSVNLWHLVSYFDNRTGKKFQVIVEWKKSGKWKKSHDEKCYDYYC